MCDHAIGRPSSRISPPALSFPNERAALTVQTRPANSNIDGVGIVTILEKQTGPELLLQKQYRPPIDKVAIEVPAGLVDAGESVETCAVRELKEETGYVGVAEKTSCVMFNGGTLPVSVSIWMTADVE